MLRWDYIAPGAAPHGAGSGCRGCVQGPGLGSAPPGTIRRGCQCNVALVAKQSAHALAARLVLHPAALVVVVHMNELPLLKRLAAHRAYVVLELQQQIEVLLPQPVAGYPVLPVGLLAGLGRLGMRVGAPVCPAARHVGDCHAGRGVARLTRTRGLLSRHPFAAQFFAHALRAWDRHSKTEWAQEGSNLRPPACKAGALPLSYAPGVPGVTPVPRNPCQRTGSRSPAGTELQALPSR